MEATGTNIELLYTFNPEDGFFRHKTYRGPRSGGPGSIAGAKMTNGYIVMTIGNKKFLAHRLVWVWMTGKWPKAEIDHINGDRSDNRWLNLREATRSQQGQNGGMRSTNKTGRVGVFFDQARQKFTFTIEKEGRKFRKRFDKFEDAVIARETMEKELFGEYAPVPRMGVPN